MFGACPFRKVEELGSLIASRRGEKAREPYFGTYHHSTSAASKKVREVVKAMFSDAFASLPFGRDDEIRILDVGCGLGFLSCVSAELYRNAQIIGIDTFKHSSLKRSSLERAKENTRILGFSDRIDFKKGDVFRFRPTEKFDIIVSNLVFHNFGKMRFKAYSRLSTWIQAYSFIVMGDLFFSPKSDIAQLTKAFRILRKIKSSKSGFEQYVLLMMSKDSGQAYVELADR
jgi:2-polyprenyl-3-methyl-5-hydroxy-6-metoxy-1,4-benzoquinol methylase